MTDQSKKVYAEDCSKDILHYLCRCRLSTCNICNLTSRIDALHKRLELVDGSLVEEPLNKSEIEKIIFFCDIIYKKGPTLSFDINHIFDHRGQLIPEIRKSVKTPKGLRDFFCKHKQIFIVKSGEVSLKNPVVFHNLRSKWIEKLLQNGHSSINKSALIAIQFYSDILYNKEPKVDYPIDQLVSHRIKAREEVQIIATNASELRSFLAAYPQIFVLDESNVYMTEAAMDKKNDHSWLDELISRKRSEIPPTLVLKTVMFFISILLNEGQLPYSTLFTFRVTASKDIKELIKTSLELKCFLSKFPEVFILEKKMVKIKDSFLSFNHMLSKDRCNVINEEGRFISQENMLKIKIQQCLERSCLLEVPLEQLMEEVTSEVENELELKAFLSNFPNDFIISDNKIILKELYCKTTDFILGKSEQLSSKLKNNVKPNNKVREEVFVRVIHYCRHFLLQTVGTNVYFPLNMLTFNTMTSPDIQQIINNVDILRWIINQYSSSLTIHKNVIVLKDNNETANVNIIRSKLDDTLKFCLWVLKANVGVDNEFPLARLKVYLDLASFQIENISELRRFLLEFPDIFIVTYNAVSLKKCDRFNKCIDICIKYKKSNCVENFSTTECIAFYSRILKIFCSNSEVPVSYLFGYSTLAPMEVVALAKDPNELKMFLSTHSNIFNVKHDQVSLSKHKSDRSTIHKSIDNSTHLGTNYINSGLCFKKLAFIAAVTFYSNIMFKKGPNSEHPISCLISYRSEAIKEVQEIARKPTELLAFLSKFPQIFSVNKTKHTVTLTDMISFYKNQRNWIKELLPKYHQSTTNHETVVSGIQFYTDIIFKESSEYALPLKSFLFIFNNRQTAAKDVQALAKNLFELKNFLAKYPEIFIVSKEIVGITSAAISQKIHPKWIEEIVCASDFNDENNFYTKPNEVYCRIGLDSNISVSMNNISIIEENRTSKGIDFFASILKKVGSNAQFPYTKMYEYWCLAPQEVKEHIKTPVQLKDFFIKHPEIFTINNDSIMLTKLINDMTVSNVTNMNDIKFSIMNSILFFTNIISRKGLYVEHSIHNLFQCHQSKASSDMKKAIKTPKELIVFLSKFPQLFHVNHNDLTVTIADLSEFQNNQHSWIKEFLPKQYQYTTNYKTIVSTIQFYSNILFEKSVKFKLPFKYLYSHRGTALEDVQTLINSIQKLKDFLSMFPDIFIIASDNVSLTNAAIIHKSQPKWIELLVSSNDISIPKIETELKNCRDVNSQELAKK